MRLAALAAALFLAAVSVADAQPSSIKVEQTWSRAAPQGRTGVLYMRIVGAGAPDRLMRVETPVAASAELHETIADHGVMKMRPLDGLAIAPGDTVTLQPGGKHIMLMGLNRPLREGDSFPVTLVFERAGAVTTTATVQKAGASHPMHEGPAPEGMQHH